MATTDPRSASLLSQQPSPPPATAPGGYGPSAKRPAAPTLGYLYYDTTLGQELVWIGVWKPIGVTPAAMVGFGASNARPVSPPPGYIFFDTTLQMTLTWNSIAWVSPNPVMVGYGTTGNRPVTPTFGYLYFDTTLTKLIGWNGAWIEIGPAGSLPPSNLPVITSLTSVSGVTNVAFTYTITATETPTSFSTAGTLPPGLSLDTGTGVISGTPTATGNFSFVVTATNGYGSGSAPLTVSVLASAAEGRWTGFQVAGTVTPSYAVIAGMILASGVASQISVNVGRSSSIQPLPDGTSGSFPPGIVYQLVSPNGTVLSYGSTNGGETNLTLTASVASAGGYTVVVGSTSSSIQIGITVSVTGSQLANSSARGLATGPLIRVALALALTGIDPATTIGSGAVIDSVSRAYLSSAQFSISFGGVSDNPCYTFPTGVNTFTATVIGTTTFYSSDAILELNGGGFG